ncbi:MAG: alkaline phosphatase [Clostridia bacterium]|nr:alkaline phosphatase [Clostridia bacterium]
MKRIICILIVFIMIFSAGCGEKGNDPEKSYINDIELSNFAIVYSAKDDGYAKRAAEYIRSEILSRTGLDLLLVDDKAESTAEYEIIVGETTRDISSRLDADTEGLEFAILAEDKQIAIEGDYFIIAAAAYYFIETYVPEDNFHASVLKEVSICQPITEDAENFIFLIGDGMGVNQTLLYEAYDSRSCKYSDNENQFYGYLFPSKGMARTNSLSGTTDSAAAATALACGYKTVNGYVGLDRHQNKLTSLTELAASLGKNTAVMSTEASTGATPGAFSAHVNDRNNSAKILSDQALLTENSKTVILCDYDEYSSSGVERIEDNIRTTLDKLDDGEKGFFVMYEEAYIDKHCHSNDMVSAYRAVVRFNQAIATFMEYAFYNPNTFVIITADHETGGLAKDEEGNFYYRATVHSNLDVPVFAYGQGSELFNGITVENIQIPHTIASFWGVTDFGDQSEYQYLK